MILLDTCIVIDVLRDRTAAVAFVKGLTEPPSLSVVSATELVAGIRASLERVEVERLLSAYSVVDVGLEIARAAGDFLREYGPSHGLDAMDALIAATAKHSGLELATLNLKHFPMFKGLKRPYRL
jgi:hypothetical protein